MKQFTLKEKRVFLHIRFFNNNVLSRPRPFRVRACDDVRKRFGLRWLPTIFAKNETVRLFTIVFAR